MKITTSKAVENPFGGFSFCVEFLQKEGIPPLIDQHLGKRVLYTGYDYSQNIVESTGNY